MTNEAGVGLQDVAVLAHRLRNGEWLESQRVPTDEDGFYQFTGLSGVYRVEFVDPSTRHESEFWDDVATRAEATNVLVRSGEVVSGVNASLAFVGAGTLSGVVTAPTGDPVPDVPVCIGSGPDWGLSTYTSEDGTFETLLPPGRHTVVVNGGLCYPDPEYLESTHEVDIADGQVTELPVQLARSAVMSGTVTDDEGAPIEGIAVNVEQQNDSGGWEVVYRWDWWDDYRFLTDPQGLFTLAGLAPAPTRLEFVDPEGRYQSEYWQNAAEAGAATVIEWPREGQVGPITAVLDLAGSIEGMVADEAGEPIVDARVTATPHGGGDETYVYTGDDGTYRLAGLTPADYVVEFDAFHYETEFWPDSLTVDGATPVTVGAGGGALRLDAVLAEPSGSISGVVRDRSSQPVAGAEVGIYVPDVWGDYTSWRLLDSVETASDGGYEATGLEHGTYRVGADHVEHLGEYWADALRVEAADDVVLDAHQQRTGIDFKLDQGSRLEGRVTDPTGQPLEDVEVAAWQVDGQGEGYGLTNAEGSFSLIVPAGTYKVQYGDGSQYWDGASSIEDATPVTVIAGDVRTGLDAELEVVDESDVGTISGKVVGEADQPLPKVRVTAYRRSDNGSWVAETSTVTDYWGDTETGEYQFHELRPGTYRIGFREMLSWQDQDAESEGQPITGLYHRSEYWDNARDLASATDIAVSAGQTITNRNATLRLTTTDPGQLANLSAPTVSGEPVVGETLTCGAGSWSPVPDSFRYRWLRDGDPIAGGAGSTYQLVAADEGALVRCEVTASKAGYQEAMATSDPVGPVEPGELPMIINTAQPTVSGEPVVGETLTCGAGSWSPVPDSFKYRWLRDGDPIAGGAGSTYQLVAADEAVLVRCEVTASKAGYQETVATSGPVGPVEPGELPMIINTAQPTVSGEPVVGETLTCGPGSWSPVPDAFGYRWLRDGDPIAGGAGSTFQLVAADEGALVRCEVTASKAGYQETVATSGPVGPVEPGEQPGGPDPQLTPTTWSFGSHGVGLESEGKIFTVSNTGDASYQGAGALTRTGSTSFRRTGGTCAWPDVTVAAGASCSIVVAFRPSAVGGHSATLTVGEMSSALSGTGAAPPDRVKPTVRVKTLRVDHAHRAATVVFTATDNVTPASKMRYQCQLDKRRKTWCKPRTRFTRVKPGQHALKVWAVDLSGNVSATVVKRFKVRRQ